MSHIPGTSRSHPVKSPAARCFDPETSNDVRASERPTDALDAKEEDRGKSGS
jgi:hypothetical protein